MNTNKTCTPNLFIKHIPNYITCEPPAPVDFNTTDELLKIVRVYKVYEKFSHFVKSDNMIMAIYDDGYEWTVAGTVKNPDSVNLPLWEGVKYRGEK